MYRRMSRPARDGFTLIELLVAITIIGILASIASFAVFGALRSARQKAILLEVNELTTAVHSYKEQFGRYPPCMGGRKLSGTVPAGFRQRGPRFQDHMKIAYPRCSRGTASTGSNSFDGHIVPAVRSYNYKDELGKVTPLEIDTMDQAESLVFWLGGFPTPVSAGGTPAIARKLFGFHTDATNWYRLDTSGDQTKFRTVPLFNFDETRLVDQDNDGWLEYIPRGTAPGTGGHAPPYVYWDADLYTSLAQKNAEMPFVGYPPTGQIPEKSPEGEHLLQEFGLCVPYARIVPDNTDDPVIWQNPDTFQILCAGLDIMYGPIEGDVRLPMFPAGTTYTGKNLNQAGYFDPAEVDNLTNFHDGPLEDGMTGT